MKQKRTWVVQITLLLILVLLIAVSASPVFGATIKVACIGDSITSGFGTGVTTPYPTALQNLLGSGYTVNNYGVISTTMLKRGDNPYWNMSQYTDSSNWLPDIVIIMLGTNDSKSYNWQYKSEFVPNYEEMINHYKNLSSHPVVYVNTSPTVYGGTTGYYGITDQVVTGEVVPLTRQAAIETGCTIIDVNTATQGMPENFPDYCHPNDAGYLVIAKTVYNALTKNPTPTPTRPGSTPTPTPTPTRTATPTPTRRMTPSPTALVTPTPTSRPNTPTPTRNGVVTATPTPTRTVTVTPSPTVRPTPTRGTGTGNYIVVYAIQSDWGNGATVNVTITNNTTVAVNGWTLAWTFPGNQTITNLWNGTYTQSGATVSVKDAGFNASIPANGGTTNFGFNMNYSGTNAKPSAFTLNGAACVVQ